eukprot:209660-Lingulodinium_polyedra.AAC.1
MSSSDGDSMLELERMKVEALAGHLHARPCVDGVFEVDYRKHLESVNLVALWDEDCRLPEPGHCVRLEA